MARREQMDVTHVPTALPTKEILVLYIILDAIRSALSQEKE